MLTKICNRCGGDYIELFNNNTCRDCIDREHFNNKEKHNTIVDRVLYGTNDDKNHNFPILTTILYKHCNQDKEKFEDMIRILELVIRQTIKEMEK